MLKPQDIVIALYIVVMKNESWRQVDVAVEIGISVSEVNAAIKRLIRARLISPPAKNEKPRVNMNALKEFLIHGLKYIFPGERGGITRGVPTSYAAPVFGNVIVYQDNDIPVWPDKDGSALGYEMLPLYHTVSKVKNTELYDFLAIIDAIREGRAREKNIAYQLLEEKFNAYKAA